MAIKIKLDSVGLTAHIEIPNNSIRPMTYVRYEFSRDLQAMRVRDDRVWSNSCIQNTKTYLHARFCRAREMRCLKYKGNKSKGTTVYMQKNLVPVVLNITISVACFLR